MKNKILALLALPLVLLACKKDFEEINTNPNAPTTVEPEFLLRQVIYDLGEQMSYESFVAGNLLSQHFAMVDFNLFDRHDLSSPQLGGNPWPVLYRNMRDNETMLNQANEASVYAAYKGPGMVLKAYIAMTLTDIYGDVPYFEAVSAKEGIINPAYSNQEAIYTADGGILDLLERAVTEMTNSTATNLKGDILYNGDLNGWIKFANSLRIKALMRISGQQNVSAQLSQIISEGNYMQGNADNATFSFTANRPNNFRMANLRDGDFNSFVMSTTMEEILDTLQDPREAIFFRPVSKDTTFNYNGAPNGRNASDAIALDTLSLPGTIFRENTAGLQANFMTAWETGFFIAEAQHIGLVSGDAKTTYDNAVRMSLEYWNAAEPNDYLSGGAATFDPNNALEQIITQKWLGNIINGYEAWIEWRRTGFPNLVPAEASLNNGQIPVRMPYPTDEEALNATNYQSAAAATNGNSVNSPVWWDN